MDKRAKQKQDQEKGLERWIEAGACDVGVRLRVLVLLNPEWLDSDTSAFVASAFKAASISPRVKAAWRQDTTRERLLAAYSVHQAGCEGCQRANQAVGHGGHGVGKLHRVY